MISDASAIMRDNDREVFGKDSIRRAGGSEVSFDPQPKAQAFADWTPSAQTPAPPAAGQTHYFSPRKV